MAGLKRLHPTLQLGDFRRDRDRQFEHGLVAGRRGLLWEMANGGVAFDVHFAFVRPIVAEREIEQRGLAGAVRADQPNPLAAIDLQRRVREQSPRAK